MASGNSLCQFFPMDNEPPSSDFATLSLRNAQPILSFDAAAVEYAIFRGILPPHYSGGGVTVKLHYAMASATSGDVVFNTAFERIGDGQQDIDSDGFASAQSATVTVPGTSGHLDVASVAHTSGGQMDSLAAGEGFRLRVSREANNGGDTATGDLNLWGVELLET